MSAIKRPVKTAKNPSRLPQPKLTPEEKFWNEVEKTSKSLIADLIEKTLPISAIPSVFDPERDVDYRLLLRDDLPNYYADNEEYQSKIATQTWTQAEVDYVAQDLVCAYFDLVVKALADWLSEYPTFDSTSLAQLKEE